MKYLTILFFIVSLVGCESIDEPKNINEKELHSKKSIKIEGQIFEQKDDKIEYSNQAVIVCNYSDSTMESISDSTGKFTVQFTNLNKTDSIMYFKISKQGFSTMDTAISFNNANLDSISYEVSFLLKSIKKLIKIEGQIFEPKNDKIEYSAQALIVCNYSDSTVESVSDGNGKFTIQFTNLNRINNIMTLNISKQGFISKDTTISFNTNLDSISYEVSFLLKSIDSSDYFPELSIGDASNWEVDQGDKTSSSGTGTYWTGNAIWKVNSIVNTDSSRISKIQRIFSGFFYHVGITIDSLGNWDWSSDTTRVKADTSYFTIEESNNHKITLNLDSKSDKYEYFGHKITFDRYFSANSNDTIAINNDYFHDVHVVNVVIAKNVGLIVYESNSGGMTGEFCHYKCLE